MVASAFRDVQIDFLNQARFIDSTKTNYQNLTLNAPMDAQKSSIMKM
jgi:hypothetical protein